jgi:hypothetical protein
MDEKEGWDARLIGKGHAGMEGLPVLCNQVERSRVPAFGIFSLPERNLFCSTL